jgi:hypothetical protein
MIINKKNQTVFFFFPMLATISVYALNAPSRESFLRRSISFPNLAEYKLSLFLISFVTIVAIVICLTQFITNVSNYHTNNTFQYLHLIVFVTLVFLPILIDKIFGFSVFRTLHKIFRVSYIDPIFADLNTTLVGIGCQTVKSVGDHITCYEISDMIWIYPSILLKLRSVGLNESVTFGLGILFVIIFASLLRSFSVENSAQRLVLALLVFSPPVLLLINRGNLDLIILICLLQIAILLNRGGKFSRELAYFLCLVAAILKFYAFAGFILLLLTKKTTANVIYFLLSTCLFIVLVFADLSKINDYVGKDMSGSIGMPVLISHFNGNSFAQTNLRGTGFILVIVLLLYYVVFFLKQIPDLNFRHYYNNIFLLLSFTFMCTWLLASNYYYRLSLLVFVIPFYFHKNSTRIEKLIGVTTLASFYISFRTLGLIFNLFLIPMLVFNCLVYRNFLLANFNPNSDKK